ncbi:hypothetical protein INS49_000100 [Diaporthe citri]|uniref:uncharacterized protein n=1 Tax=Diaporthe citri TaxID=83186 RepID=UPI001C7E4497|nr:uncharacterized protein INS49_000100 [Diaporthe citri]KAG6365924.1 hypothetical protein INS49_000100 [Diaporthe citri]
MLAPARLIHSHYRKRDLTVAAEIQLDAYLRQLSTGSQIEFRIARTPEPFATVSLNDILESDEPRPSRPPSLRRQFAPSKPPTPSSVVGRNYSTTDSSEETSGMSSTRSASPRRSSLFSPDPALADDEGETTGPERDVSRGSLAAGRDAGTG